MFSSAIFGNSRAVSLFILNVLLDNLEGAFLFLPSILLTFVLPKAADSD